MIFNYEAVNMSSYIYYKLYC